MKAIDAVKNDSVLSKREAFTTVVILSPCISIKGAITEPNRIIKPRVL